MINLTPHYKGMFEAFRHNNRQYARLELASGSYYWFEYDFFNERYDLITMISHNVDLQSQLEEAYQQHIPMPDQ